MSSLRLRPEVTVRFRTSFVTDLRAIKDQSFHDRIKNLIAKVESVQSLSEVPNLKKLRGGGGYYRVRVGDYRVGLAVEEKDVVFVRVLHRREVYRYFP
jgi:mRNA interferase RelE/StbE